MNDEAELVRRYQHGDIDAFEQLVRRYQDRVFRIAGSLLRDPGLAEDAVQEVFLRAWRGLQAFEFRSSPYTWIYAATRNVCREFNRRHKGYDQVDSEMGIVAPQGRDLDGMTCLRIVHAMIRDLPERQRDVVLLRIFEDMSVEDTARTLQCRPGTVKATLHQAMKRLREAPGLARLRLRETDD